MHGLIGDQQWLHPQALQTPLGGNGSDSRSAPAALSHSRTMLHNCRFCGSFLGHVAWQTVERVCSRRMRRPANAKKLGFLGSCLRGKRPWMALSTDRKRSSCRDTPLD